MTNGSRSRDEREQRVRKENALKAKKRRRNIIFGFSGAGVAIVALVAFIVVLAQSVPSGNLTPSQGYRSEARLEVTSDSVILGNPDAAHTVTIYEDLICPFCQAFEQSSAEQVQQIIDSDDTKVEYKIVAFLDSQSSDGTYSTRAGSLLAAVANNQPSRWQELHTTLYDQQPAEGSTLTNSQLLDVAREAGVDITPDIEASVNNASYGNWVGDVTQAAFGDDDITGTPSIFIDGSKVNVQTGEQLQSELDKVLNS